MISLTKTDEDLRDLIAAVPAGVTDGNEATWRKRIRDCVRQQGVISGVARAAWIRRVNGG